MCLSRSLREELLQLLVPVLVIEQLDRSMWGFAHRVYMHRRFIPTSQFFMVLRSSCVMYCCHLAVFAVWRPSNSSLLHVWGCEFLFCIHSQRHPVFLRTIIIALFGNSLL
jgi:hypothetical protein